MMMHVTEESSVNSAMMVCESGIQYGARLASWLKKHSQDAVVKNIEDACSAYRGGFVKKPEAQEIKDLIDGLRGTTSAQANEEFFFMGDAGDLSCFWKKADAKNHCVLPREVIDSISDLKLKKNVISTFTQAELEGKVKFDGKVYTLTNKGKATVCDPGFVAKRIAAEEAFFQKAKENLKKALKGLENVKSGDELFVFTKGTEAQAYAVMDTVIDGEGLAHMKLSSPEGELLLPGDAMGKIVFADKEQGVAYVQAHPDEASEYQELIRVQQEAKEQDVAVEEYTKNITETEDAYLIGVGDNDYEHLAIPKEDVEALENGSIKATMYEDKEYTVTSGDRSYKVNGNGARDLLNKGADVKQKAAEAGQKAIEAGKQAAGAALNTVDSVATAVPAAKAVTSAVKVIYKLAQTAGQAAQTTGGLVRSL